MFKIKVMQKGDILPNDDIFYIITKNGLMIRKKLDLIDALVPVNNISYLQDVKPYVKINIPKISEEIFCKIVSLFREVNKLYNSECICLLYLDKNNSEYIVNIPSQKVGHGGVSYIREPLNNFILVASIHSHSSFSAFHSSIDKEDEKSFDGLHITVGNLDEENYVTICSSIVSNGFRVKVSPTNYINGVEKYEEKIYKINNRYFVKNFDFEQEWLDKIEPKIKIVKNYLDFDYIDEYDDFEFESNDEFFKKFTERNKTKTKTPCEACTFNSFRRDYFK